jgi:hypothetical protein
MAQLPLFPAEVYSYVRKVFAGANRRISQKIARVPNCPEPSLDTTFIEYLSDFGSPRIVAPGWAVRIDVHYLGGMRHFMGWEIADIGLLILAKQGTKNVAKKVALLQSKRLYPLSLDVVEQSPEDYRIGFGGLLPSGDTSRSLGISRTFKFTEASKYKAFKRADQQQTAIDNYEDENGIPIHYLFYNPWQIPCEYQSPVVNPPCLGLKANGGCRVIPAKTIKEHFASKASGYSPNFGETSKLLDDPKALHGWRLEYFVADLVMKCKQGYAFQSLNEDNIYNLFNRRSGPISAAISVTIEQLNI